MNSRIKCAGCSLLIVLVGVVSVRARQVFVDASLSVASTTTYRPSDRSARDGSYSACRGFYDALPLLGEGDTLYIRQTTYRSSLAIALSASAEKPILISAYPDEKVTITGVGVAPAINISGSRHVIIQGLTVDSVRHWLYAVNTHHCIIRNNTFSNAVDPGRSSKIGLFFDASTFNRIEGNTLHQTTNDNLGLHNSHYNLVIRNRITSAGHVLWTIKCGNYNVLRENYFANPDQKIGEVYDCDGAGFDHQYDIADSTRHNLIENNVFAQGIKYYSTSGGNGIQYAGQAGIVRRNVFYNCNAGIGMQYYSAEALHNKYNRIYHNVFYKNECGGIALSGATDRDIIDNKFVNNVLYENLSCAQKGHGQVVFRNGPLGEALFMNNCIFSTRGTAVIDDEFNGEYTLSHFQTSLPQWFVGNISVEPQFVDAGSYDFRLQNASPLIDAGAFLTTTAQQGSGTEVTVVDARFFYDGYGIAGLAPDSIGFAGSELRYALVKVDYGRNRLTLDRAATWQAGQGVSLAYTGSAPDIGAIEFGTSSATIHNEPYPGSLRGSHDAINATDEVCIFDLHGRLVSRSTYRNCMAASRKLGAGIYFFMADHSPGRGFAPVQPLLIH